MEWKILAVVNAFIALLYKEELSQKCKLSSFTHLFLSAEHNNEGCEDCQAPKSTVNYLCALRPSSEGLRVLDNFHRSQSPMQYQEEFILNFTLHGYTKQTLVTKTDKTDTPCCVYASF